MQLRRSAVGVASHIADGHGQIDRHRRYRKLLGVARGALNELQTQIELAESLGFLDKQAGEQMLNLRQKSRN